MKIDKEKFHDAKEVAKQAVAHHCKTSCCSSLQNKLLLITAKQDGG